MDAEEEEGVLVMSSRKVADRLVENRMKRLQCKLDAEVEEEGLEVD